MSTIFWKALKLSPALLSASLLVAGSTYAAQTVPDQTQTNTQTAAIETAVEPIAQLPQNTDVASNSTTSKSAPDQAAVNKSLVEAIATPTVAVSTQPPQSSATETPVSGSIPSVASPSTKQTDTTIAQQAPSTGNTNSNSNEVLDQIQRYSNDGQSGSPDQDQVTNVTQLSDVRPTDWAYEALRSLVERYGCIQGYPDRTFRGNRATTRYEFAAGLNACLNQIERLIASSTADFVRRQDLETLQRLVDEFRGELTTLGARVDKLEGRAAFLENHEFSTTTKLRGEVLFNVADLFGDNAGALAGNPRYNNDNTVFQDRIRLNFDTSFSGKDLLRTRIQAFDAVAFGPINGPSSPGVRLANGNTAFVTREGRFGFDGDNGNTISLDRLFYRFPVTNQAQVYIGANAFQYEDFVDLLNPGFDPSGTGAISRFGRYNPIYSVVGQSQGIGISVGGAKSPIRIDVGYLTNVGNDPSEKRGLFDGNYTALGQLTFKPTNRFRVAGTYLHSYNNSNVGLGLSTGSIDASIGGTRRPVVGNSYGVEATFAFTPQLVVSGWGGYMNAIVLKRGTADVWTYGGTLAINDVGAKGNTLGFVVGMEPRLTGTSNATVASLITGTNGRRKDPDVGLHVEGFYKFKVSNNILVTPGVIWLTDPGHNSNNDSILIGTIRTTFTFKIFKRTGQHQNFISNCHIDFDNWLLFLGLLKYPFNFSRT